MNLFTFVAIALLGFSEAQIVLHESAIEWPENINTLGGALFGLSYSSLGNGSCIVQLPAMANLFHVSWTLASISELFFTDSLLPLQVVNGFIVPDDSSPVEGLYKISAPMHWNFANQTFRVLLIFAREARFNLTDIDFFCDPTDVSESK